jgi:hypothetical protein
MSSTQVPVLNTSTSATVRHHSASNGDLKDNIEPKYEIIVWVLLEI